jgi:hypothetical protein
MGTLFRNGISYGGLQMDTFLSILAPVEEPIATSNHAIGDYVIFDNQFCKVTQAIRIGDSVAIGTNLLVTTVAAELNA